MEQIDLEDAVKVVESMDEADANAAAAKAVLSAMFTYRHLYEGEVKRMMRFHDIAAKPDIEIHLKVKDDFGTLMEAKEAFKDEIVSGKIPECLTFEEWLFSDRSK